MGRVVDVQIKTKWVGTSRSGHSKKIEFKR
jgi:hypothetical protein